MNSSIKSKDSETTEISIKKRDEIHKVKYNIFLALNSKCNPATNEFQDILEGRYLRDKRLVIQDIEKSEGITNYGSKRYAFKPLNSKEIFKIENDVIEIKKQGNRLIMTLNNESLIDEDKFNEICHNSNDIKEDNNNSKNS